MNFDIPELDIRLCADRLVAPVTKWGTRRRTDPMPGTWHLYCNDYVFTHLIKWPELLLATGCAAAVEPNFSTTVDMPLAEVLWLTYQKRRIARRWQELGVKIIVDLNMAPRDEVYEINFLGVPKGWTAYATRAHDGVTPDQLDAEFNRAASHAGTDQILFVVFGGRAPLKRHFRHRGWAWAPAHRQANVRASVSHA